VTLWAGGHYDAVADRIAPIAAEVVAAAGRCVPLADARVVDLACGTGNAALAAAAAGARVTGVDVTTELLDIAARAPGGRSVTWVGADAMDTGLAAGEFDAAVSNMGIIFVDPGRQVAEIARLLRPGGVLAFSAWVRKPDNPLSAPIAAVFGAPPAGDFTPDQWGEPDAIRARLDGLFDKIEIEKCTHTWEFDSMMGALFFLTGQSPMHVAVFAQAEEPQRRALAAAFEDALDPHLCADGAVRFDTPYVVVSAVRRA
jgi:SAM-dependent methyltransferase